MIARLHALAHDLRTHPEDALAFGAAFFGLWLILHIADRIAFGLFVSGIL
ncbi:hypothetical protein ABC955_15325 [Citromicrobium bathyomarinum]